MLHTKFQPTKSSGSGEVDFSGLVIFSKVTIFDSRPA